MEAREIIMPVIINGELYSSKNHRKIVRTKKRMFVVKADKAKRQEFDFGFQLLSSTNKKEWDKMMEGKAYPIRVSFKIYRTTRRRFDYTNIIQGLLDAMVKASYVPDDSADYLIPEFQHYEVDALFPRTIISVL